MDNLIDKIVAYIKSLTREDIILLLIVLSPAILTTILMAIGEADQRETQRRLENRPNVTWREIMTPEERKQMGFDHFDEMEKTFQQGQKRKIILNPGKASKGETDLEESTTTDSVAVFTRLTQENRPLINVMVLASEC